MLAAKAFGFGGVAVIFGAVIAYIMFAVAQPILASRGLDVSLTDPAALRGVGLAALATAGFAGWVAIVLIAATVAFHRRDA